METGSGRPRWRRNVYLLSFSNVFLASSYTMIVPFLPLYLLELGTPADEVKLYSGVIFSVAFFIAAIMGPIWGKLADGYGLKPMVLRAATMLALSYLTGGIVTSALELAGMRVLQGFANGFIPMSLAMCSQFAPPEQLGFAIGIAQTGQFIGTVMGPLIGGTVASAVGIRRSFFVAGGSLLTIAVILAIFLDKPPQPATAGEKTAQRKTSIFEDMARAAHNRQLLLMMFMTMMMSMTHMALQPVLSLHLADLMGTFDGVVFTAGWVFSLAGIAGSLATVFWGRYGQGFGFARVIGLGYLAAGVIIFLQGLADSVYLFAAMQFLFGLTLVGATPAISSLLAQSCPPDFRGRGFGLSATAYQVGGILGPIIGSFIATTLNIRAVFPLVGCWVLAIGAYVWYHRKEIGSEG